MTFYFSKRSLNNLIGVHADLVRVVNLALTMTPIDFGIINGVRTCLRQHELCSEGASQLDCPPPAGGLMGRHVTGHAVDFDAFVNGVETWDTHYYIQLGGIFKSAAMQLHIPIHWGGDNPHWKDWDHIELSRNVYPDQPLVS